QDAEGEHEGEYTHTRPLHSDQSHISPEMNHSPHQNGSGRATPRSANPYPQRASQLPSSNLNYVIGNDTRAGAPNGAEPYPAQGGYPPQQYPPMNGNAPQSNKRMREDDQDESYNTPMSAGGDPSLKRQRTDPGIGRPMSQPHSVKAGGARR
ncbi:hypothetical protein B0A55_13017, partial [Friedmanniomyces simplex]